MSRQMAINDYIDLVASADCVLPAIAYLYLIIVRESDLCEIDAQAVKPVCVMLNNAWTLHSSAKCGNSLDDDWMPFFILKCCDLMYSLESCPRKSMLVGSRRRSLLLDFGWERKQVTEYTTYPEFWLKMISVSVQLYINDAQLLQWAIRNANIHMHDSQPRCHIGSMTSADQSGMSESTALTSDDGIFDVATLLLAGGSMPDSDPDTPSSTTKKAANESALREVCRWKIYAGDDVVKLSQFCKKASLKFHLKSSLVHTVLLSLEDCFLWHDIGEPAVSRTAIDGRTCLQLVFPYLTAAEGLSLTLACREFRVAYRLPHLRSVLQFCSLPSSVRLSIWMQFVGGVAVS